MVIWTCKDCGATKDVVCPVCGLGKKAGETCRRCGSEYSHTTCHECGGAEHYDEEPGETDYLEKVRVILRDRDQKYLTYYELMRVAAILKPEALSNLCRVDPIEVKEKSQRAFEQGEKGFIRILTKLSGMEKALASDIWERLA